MAYPLAPTYEKGQRILGLTLHLADVADVHRYISKVIHEGKQAAVLNLNIHCVHLALKLKWLQDCINSAQLVFCDGDGVRWGAKLLGLAVPTKITYDRWIWQLAEYCEQRQHSLFLLGAKPGVSEDAARKLREKFPRLIIKGTHHGYFKHDGNEEEAVNQIINDSKPDILVVAFGMPLQEKWLMKNARKLNVHVFLNGGAVLDYASGRAKRAPAWMIRANLEWLYRLIQEPKRLFLRYAVDIPYFFIRVVYEIFTGRPNETK